MNEKDLINRPEDIEREDFEVKEAKTKVPKSIRETVSALSNTARGWIISGVKKEGKNYHVTGVDNPEKIEPDFITTLRGGKFNKKITVKSKKYVISGKSVPGFHVSSVSATDKPVYFNSQINTFIRTGSGYQRATKEEIDAMYRNSSFDKKDEEITSRTIEDPDERTIDRYRTYLKNIDPEHMHNQLSTKELLKE